MEENENVFTDDNNANLGVGNFASTSSTRVPEGDGNQGANASLQADNKQHANRGCSCHVGDACQDLPVTIEDALQANNNQVDGAGLHDDMEANDGLGQGETLMKTPNVRAPIWVYERGTHGRLRKNLNPPDRLSLLGWKGKKPRKCKKGQEGAMKVLVMPFPELELATFLDFWNWNILVMPFPELELATFLVMPFPELELATF
ncbi:hypothetical protein TorRG33x02_042460 [Trema orientale]|uniref:Uncharacterized protein n=1 Tax=Trema orientale TaxID=63057 RepID=A0A2P5FPW4_TREOI|nr:hypothetical protein TorRG33x02_042460 [Trema orientale]